MQVNNKFLIDLHTVRPVTQSNYTRSCINTIVHLRMSTELLETCRGLKRIIEETVCQVGDLIEFGCKSLDDNRDGLNV
jgi:hypothetical protein